MSRIAVLAAVAAAFAAAAAGGCAGRAPVHAAKAPQPASQSASLTAPRPAGDPREPARAFAPQPVGRILHYLRSDQDGGEREWIDVYRRDERTIEVYKMRGRCSNAALVVAELDPARGQARRLLGGRLLPDAGREMFATLDYDPASRTIDATVRLPDRTLSDRVVVDAEPWHLYDFDLASLSALPPPQAAARRDFSFGLPLVLLGDDPAAFLTNLGRADARFAGEAVHDGHASLRYEVGGPAFGDRGGPLWLDRVHGHVVEARWGVPNHAGYRDFRLRLLSVEDGGAAAWDRRLRAHFDGCG